MSPKNLFYNFSCPRCGQTFLPLEEEGSICPLCKTCCAPDPKPPSVREIVQTAWANVRLPEVPVRSCADVYMACAWQIILEFLIRRRDAIQDEEAIDNLASTILAKKNFFEDEHQREHAFVFVKSVLREFGCMIAAGEIEGWNSH